MKRLRGVLPAAGVLVLLAAALFWSMRPQGFRTPEQCVKAYREAGLAGDGPRYLACLAEPLRSQTRQRFSDESALADRLRMSMQDLKGWAQTIEATADDGVAVVTVDEVRTAETRRCRLRLERTPRGWLIAGIEPAKVVPTEIPYGTHISKVEGAPPQGKEDEGP